MSAVASGSSTLRRHAGFTLLGWHTSRPANGLALGDGLRGDFGILAAEVLVEELLDAAEELLAAEAAVAAAGDGDKRHVDAGLGECLG